MIEFYSETDFSLEDKRKIRSWIKHIANVEGHELGEINYIFCDDNYLAELNQKYLDHDTLTDILTFDFSEGKKLSGDVFISIERVQENANIFNTKPKDELHRVMIHGILHLCGYKDKSKDETKVMRIKENEALKMLNSL
jgi:rRNA maturation RNase YbeY